MNSTYAVAVTWGETPMHPPLIDAVLGFAGDWIRFNSEFWILRSTKSTVEVQELIRRHLKPGDSFLVLPFDPNGGGGLAPMWMWNWMGNTGARPVPALPTTG